MVEEKRPEVSVIDWARMAVLIDGEGCISIGKQRVSAKHAYHCLYLSVTNTDLRIVAWCNKTFGGSIHIKRRRSSSRKECFQWVASSKRAEEVIRGCLPYFLSKREQAELALLFRETFSKDRKTQVGSVTASLEPKRERFRQLLSSSKLQDWSNFVQ